MRKNEAVIIKCISNNKNKFWDLLQLQIGAIFDAILYI